MQEERTLESLTLENEDYIFAGNLTILGDVHVTNGSLIVSGKITFYHYNSIISITGGDIVAQAIESHSNITIVDGDICAKYLEALTIVSDGNIEVNGDTSVENIIALNYFVTGTNDSINIITTQDFYVLGDNYSNNITARDVLINGDNASCAIDAQQVVIGGSCDCNGNTIIAKTFYCYGELYDCYSVQIG